MANSLSRLRWVLLIVNLALIGAIFILWSQKNAMLGSRPVPALPVYAEVPEFSMIDETAQPFTKASLLGKAWVADFIFTRCGGICPMMSSHTKALQAELKDMHFVSFSTDPEYDSPQVLKAYGERYEAEPGRWVFLTGDKATLNRIANAFKMSSIDEPMMHSATFVLIDKEGKVRGFYDPSDAAKLAQLKADAKKL